MGTLALFSLNAGITSRMMDPNFPQYLMGQYSVKWRLRWGTFRDYIWGQGLSRFIQESRPVASTLWSSFAAFKDYVLEQGLFKFIWGSCSRARTLWSSSTTFEDYVCEQGHDLPFLHLVKLFGCKDAMILFCFIRERQSGIRMQWFGKVIRV